MEIQITFKGIEHSQAVEDDIREKARKLERFSGRILSCHVVIEAPHQRHHKGNIYSTHIDLKMPGMEIVVGRDPMLNHAHEDIYVAIRDAFDAAVRKLEDYVRKQRGDVKTHEAPER